MACESGRPARTAFCKPVFAKKVIEALRTFEPWSAVAQELHSHHDTSVPEPANCDSPLYLVGADDMPQEEKDRILRLVKHIHSNTGHGSMKNLLEALKRRGVSNAVLEVAKQFECPVCEERKRAAPRRPASLETLPQKWQVIQSDLGSWQHPITKHNIKFILFIDEGCRFRVGKILFEDSRQQATWPVVQQCFEEIWLPVFGKPEVIRVDPEGVWRGRDAEAYCQEREIEMSPVPAEFGKLGSSKMRSSIKSM